MPQGPENSTDIGHGVYMRFVAWAPDRALNPQFDDLPDNDKTGIVVGHVHDDGEICEGLVLFDTPENQPRETDPPSPAHSPVWQVESLEPLTISPSIHMDPAKGGCGLHGYVRDGAWEPA